MKFSNTETRRKTKSRAVGRIAKSPKGLGRSGNKPLMRNRRATIAPPDSYTARDTFTVEHILLSVTVVSTNKLIQYDDSAARLLELELPRYAGVVRVKAKVNYDHTKLEYHPNNCECGHCKP